MTPSQARVAVSGFSPVIPVHSHSSVLHFALHTFWGKKILIWLWKYYKYRFYSFLCLFWSHLGF